MANLKRNVFLSLAAVITSMSTISMNVAASQDQTQPVMPLEEDEYLVLTVGESHYSWLGGDLVLVLDASGEEVARLSGYGLTGNGPSMSRGLILKQSAPLEVFAGYQDGAEVQSDAVSASVGLYSLADQDWLVEPSENRLNLLSDSLYTDGDMVSNLYKTDGTCIKEMSDGAARRGNYVIDSQNVYDLDGQELMALDGLKFRELIGDEILLIGYNEDGSHWTQLTKADGTTVWTEDSGLIWTGSVDDYSSWTDADGKGQILVMGETPETVLTEEGFLAKNAEVQGSGMCLAAVKESEQDGQQFVIRMTDLTGNSWFYLCDAEFHVVTAYPENQVYWNETDGQLWYWTIGEGSGGVKNLLTDETMTWKQEGLSADQLPVPLQVEVMQAGSTIGMVYRNPSGTGKTFVCGIGEDTAAYTDETSITARMTALNDGTVEVYILSGAYTENETDQVAYYTPDGKAMESDDSVLFQNQSMKCIQTKKGIEIENADGNVINMVGMNE